MTSPWSLLAYHQDRKRPDLYYCCVQSESKNMFRIQEYKFGGSILLIYFNINFCWHELSCSIFYWDLRVLKRIFRPSIQEYTFCFHKIYDFYCLSLFYQNKQTGLVFFNVMASGGLYFSYLHNNSQSLLIIFVHWTQLLGILNTWYKLHVMKLYVVLCVFCFLFGNFPCSFCGCPLSGSYSGRATSS